VTKAWSLEIDDPYIRRYLSQQLTLGAKENELDRISFAEEFVSEVERDTFGSPATEIGQEE